MPILTPLWQGAEGPIEIPNGRVTIGRAAENVLQLDHETVSSHHCMLVGERGLYLLRDLGSTNGVYVNGHAVDRMAIRNGDHVRIGVLELSFSASPGDEDATAEGLPRLPETVRMERGARGASAVRPPTAVIARPVVPVPSPAPAALRGIPRIPQLPGAAAGPTPPSVPTMPRPPTVRKTPPLSAPSAAPSRSGRKLIIRKSGG